MILDLYAININVHFNKSLVLNVKRMRLVFFGVLALMATSIITVCHLEHLWTVMSIMVSFIIYEIHKVRKKRYGWFKRSPCLYNVF